MPFIQELAERSPVDGSGHDDGVSVVRFQVWMRDHIIDHFAFRVVQMRHDQLVVVAKEHHQVKIGEECHFGTKIEKKNKKPSVIGNAKLVRGIANPVVNAS